MLVAPEQSEFWKFFWQAGSALAALVRLSGSAWLNRRTVLLSLTEICWEGIADAGIAAAAEGHRRTRPGRQEAKSAF